MKIRPVRGDLFHADRQTDRHDEANGYFSQFYHLHNGQPLVPIPNQMKPIHVFPSYYFKIQFNIIFPSTRRSF
jgi:hypothetical protein